MTKLTRLFPSMKAWLFTLGPKGFSKGCRVFSSRSCTIRNRAAVFDYVEGDTFAGLQFRASLRRPLSPTLADASRTSQIVFHRSGPHPTGSERSRCESRERALRALAELGP